MSDAPSPSSVGEFLSLAAHDIRQPLNVLQMYLGILQSQAGVAEEDELGQVVGASMRSLQSMINLLINWSKIGEEGLKTQPAPIDLPDWYKYINSIDGVNYLETETSETSSNGSDRENVDLNLLTRTVRDMMSLLTAGAYLLPTATPWSFEIHTKESSDYLQQLALTGGGTILGALGFKVETATKDGAVIFHATITD